MPPKKKKTWDLIPGDFYECVKYRGGTLEHNVQCVVIRSGRPGDWGMYLVEILTGEYRLESEIIRKL